jgi:hypothetical protein
MRVLVKDEADEAQEFEVPGQAKVVQYVLRRTYGERKWIRP